MQDTPLKLLDVVAVLEDKPEEGLVSGQVGTVVEVLAPDVFEVEFLDSRGRTGEQVLIGRIAAGPPFSASPTGGMPVGR